MNIKLVRKDVSELPLEFITSVAKEKGGKVEFERGPGGDIRAYLEYQEKEEYQMQHVEGVLTWVKRVNENKLARCHLHYEVEEICKK